MQDGSYDEWDNRYVQLKMFVNQLHMSSNNKWVAQQPVGYGKELSGITDVFCNNGPIGRYSVQR